MIRNLYLLLSLVLFAQFSMTAQGGIVRGKIFDASSGEPIIYGNVVLQNTDLGTTTDLDGLYNITSVPAGSYDLEVRYIGFKTDTISISVKDNIVSYNDIFLESDAVNLGVIDISGRREQARTEVQISKIQVSKRQIEVLPSTGADPDLIQYLQVLPGVISTGDQGGQLFIRGGSPVQNKILLDGLTIYNPFHSIGFYSVFDTELIKNVDVLTGGFGAEYGGRISAIVDITSRSGNRKKLGGQFSASPFMVKGLIEGPIIRLKEDGGSTASFVLTHKESIIDQTSPTLYDYASVNDSIGLPFKFSDTYGKLSFATPNGSQFNIFGFNFTDGFNNPAVADINWENVGGGLDFSLVPSRSNLLVDGLIGYSSYDIGLVEADNDPRSSKINELLVQFDFGLFENDYSVNYGFELKTIKTSFVFSNPFNITIDQFQNTTELGGYFSFRRTWDKLIIEPGIRFQYYASLSEGSFEPRLGLKYKFNDDFRFKAAAGLYSQNLISSSNERDVVNLFTGFLSGPESQFLDFNGDPATSKLQKSRHLIAGFEYDISNKITFNIEGYYKDNPQIIVVNRNKLSAFDPNFVTEEGKAYGVDFSARYDYNSLYLWATYSLGFVDRFDGNVTYPTVFDRRHNTNFLVSYNFGADHDWSASIRWNLGSGFPFTKTQGFYNSLNFQDGISTDYVSSNPDEVGIIFSDTRNGGRLPYYHRLDVSVKKRIEFNDAINMEITASVSNAYDRNNIFYFDRVRFERVDQLPLIPSVGVVLNFN